MPLTSTRPHTRSKRAFDLAPYKEINTEIKRAGEKKHVMSDLCQITTVVNWSQSVRSQFASVEWVCLLAWITWTSTSWSTLRVCCSGETEDLLEALALHLRLVFMNHWLISQQSVKGHLQSWVLTNHVNELFSEGQSEWLSKRREL